EAGLGVSKTVGDLAGPCLFAILMGTSRVRASRRTKRFSLKPMTVEEAILQMKLLEHEFFAFLNQEDDDSFSVVYKRKQGGYGLISAADVDD
ncbi:MAG: sigma 54 modulation/S30EA ribosomal C-terminal domain-containing protein, partial [Clostridia bacterium]|nr:sigma 54 modulation/S30EA ribosomal C-terminal domain-containing protein [Clostridia bacterium]